MDFDKVERYFKDILQFLYARVILEQLNYVVKENCYGCEVDHPSQIQHTCIMLTKLEHLDTYFDTTFNKIDEKDIKIQLQNQISLMDMSEDYKSKVFEQFDDWCSIHKPKSNTLRETTERLLLLECRLEKE